MTAPNGVADDRALLQRAIDIAFPMVEADIHIPDIERLLSSGDVSNDRLLAHAFLCAMDRLTTATVAPPREFRCGWCAAQTDGSADAWRALPGLDDAAIKAHTQTCEHNPLVRENAKLRDLLEEQGWIEGSRAP